MFTLNTTIRLRQTDASGILYFIEQPQLAMEAFEQYLLSHSTRLDDFFEKEGFALPVVHVESDFFHPLRVSDNILVELRCKKIGTTSFTLESEIFLKKKVGTVQIVHVAVDRKTSRPTPLPPPILTHLHPLQ